MDRRWYKPKKMITMPVWCYKVERLVHDKRVPEWCRLPYPGHPKGCPMYGQRPKCPPQAPYITDVLDLTRPVYMVHSDFNLQAHVERMRALHPGWTDRQCRCVLYWQARSKRQMAERAEDVLYMVGADTICKMPEAAGVNVYATAKLLGLSLERIKDITICRHIAFVGWRP